MASVHLGLQRGDEGFRRAVAIKRLHAQFAKDPDFASALVDEGRTQARVHHPNVAAALDVVRASDELLLVMEYVHGASLHELVRACRMGAAWPSIPILSALVVGTLRGLHAAHEAKSTSGAPLEIVHRDVSPQNVLVGVDGVPRVVDFGIAHAAERLQITREGTIKGKPGYMAPEQIRGERPTRTADVYAAGVLLWELLTHERLFPGGDFIVVARAVIDAKVDPPSAIVPSLPPAVDAIVARAIDRDPEARFPTAAAFADALEALGPIASAGEVAGWVARTAPEILARRSALLDRVERGEVTEGAPSVARATTASAADTERDVPAGLDREPRTETSSSAILPARGSARPRRATAFVALGAVTLTVGIGGGIVVGRSASGSGAATSDAPPSLPSAAAPATNVQPSASATATASAVATATVTAAATAVVAASASDPPRPAPSVKSGRGRGSPGSESCVTVGADGIKHWNPRCR